MNQSGNSPEAIRSAYEQRRPVLEELASRLEKEVVRLLAGTPRIDRVCFRAKTVDSFVDKALKLGEDEQIKYKYPLEELEDQVAGRAIVLLNSDIAVVQKKIEAEFRAVESVHKQAPPRAFHYESQHIVLAIPPDLKPEPWSSHEAMATMFEFQIRTVFMHAWAEPGHFFYKGPTLAPEHERRLAWAAASAWGADRAFQELFDDLGGSSN